MSLAPTGLVIGRFIPPHLGHSHLIEEAISQSTGLSSWSTVARANRCPAISARAWLAELHPLARVVEVRHDLDTDFNDAGVVGEMGGAVLVALAVCRRSPHRVLVGAIRERARSSHGRPLGRVDSDAPPCRSRAP